jgi:hypothetical protein
VNHRPMAELENGLDHVCGSPRHQGRIELIVRRPGVDEREVVERARLDGLDGLVGDTWRVRGNRRTEDGGADPEAQITLMNIRVADLVAATRNRLAGDQLYVDFDLSHASLPAGSRLELGSAVVEISAKPHLGCDKFMSRFGKDALRFVNSAIGRELRLRGANAKVVVSGTVRVGDQVRKLPSLAGAEPATPPETAPAA